MSSTGEQGNNNSSYSTMSPDGRYVAFESIADNLVAGDTNGFRDIFVHDRQTGQTTRVSVSSTGEQGNIHSSYPSISSDGRYVAFYSWAGNLVAGDTNVSWDVFVHDRQTGETTLVSVSSTGVQMGGLYPSMSSDGRYVAFESMSDDVFVHDRQTGQTTRVSVSSTGVQGYNSGAASISSDGRYVEFTSEADNLVADDTNGSHDIFVHDRQTGETTRVSVSSTGVQGNGRSLYAEISSDGRYVVFNSEADNLVADDTNGVWDFFVHDRQTGETTRVSVSSTGVQGNGDCYGASISFDGRYVAFNSDSDNLVVCDSNGVADTFVHDRQTGETTRVSVSSTGVQGNWYSSPRSISSDGRYVAISSWADNLVAGDTNGVGDVFVHERLPESVDHIPRYRLYNPFTYHHHYTTNANEYEVLETHGWIQEGTSCCVYGEMITNESVDAVPYFRLYNPNSLEHLWTTDANEYDVLGTIGWIQEGVDGYVFPSQVTGSEPLHRLYNPNDGLHHWTVDSNERTVLIGSGWIDEGIACYVFSTIIPLISINL